jgi:hypothetical protein
MRHLLQPRVLKLAGSAALVSALACYPRLTLWQNRPAPIWYLEAVIFLCSIVLWGFVFAWHTQYANRPVFVFKLEPGLFVVVTLIGIIAAAVFHLWIDPSLRTIMPKEYPDDLRHWFAMALFALALNQLFQVFAPFAWFMRLLKNPKVSASLTVSFGAFLLAIKIWALPAPVPPLLLAALLVSRIVMGFLVVSFYLRGGMILVSWWTFILEARHLLDLTSNP